MSDLFDDKDRIPDQGEEGETKTGTGVTAGAHSEDAGNSRPEDENRDTVSEVSKERRTETAETEDASAETPAEANTGAEDASAETPAEVNTGAEDVPAETPAEANTETEDSAAEISAEKETGAEDASAETPAEKETDTARPASDASPEEKSGPNESENPPKQEEHDFDDEPKFDTQTGEPLSKPKSRVPGILMTFAVTAGVVCAIVAAFVNKSGWSGSPEEGRTEVETEAASGISAGRETESGERQSEKVSETESQTGKDVKSDSGNVVLPAGGTAEETEKAGRSGTAKESEGPETAETEEISETETPSEKEKTDLKKDLSREAVSLNTSLDVSAMAAETLPSVVSVTSQSVQTVRSFFYGEQQIRTSNVGSGVVVDEDADFYYIVTEAYLAAHTQNLTVGFSAYEDGSGSFAESETDSSGEEAQTEPAVSSGESEEEDSLLQNGAKSQQDDALADAGLVGTDDTTELAVLSVRKSDLPEKVRNSVRKAVLGDSDRLKIGERVVAIGDSLGYGQSVTQGIISALNRTMNSSYGTHAYIQTDASINYGNYGGALLDLEGHVVGINAGKVSGQSAEGMGYALPVNDAKTGIEKILDGKGNGLSEEEETEDDGQQGTGVPDEERESEQQAMLSTPSEGAQNVETTEPGKEDEVSSAENGNRKNGVLGVRVADLSKENQIVYRVPAGVYVVSVDEGSGAATAGIQADDVITAVGDTDVSSVSDLQEALAGTQPGDKIRVEYIRPDKDGRYTDSEAADVTLH